MEQRRSALRRNPQPAAQSAARIRRRHAGGCLAVRVRQCCLLLRPDAARDRQRADKLLRRDGGIEAVFGANGGLHDGGCAHDFIIWFAALERARKLAGSLCNGTRRPVLSGAGPPFTSLERSGPGDRRAGRVGQRAGSVGLVRYADRLGGIRLVALLRFEHRIAVRFQKDDARCSSALSSPGLSRRAHHFPLGDRSASDQHIRCGASSGAAGHGGIDCRAAALLVLVAKKFQCPAHGCSDRLLTHTGARSYPRAPASRNRNHYFPAGKSNTSTSASFPCSRRSCVPSVTLSASPAPRATPLATKAPRATCTYSRRPLFTSRTACSPPSNNPA